MTVKSPEHVEQRYLALRRQGLNQTDAAARCGYSIGWGRKIDKKYRQGGGVIPHANGAAAGIAHKVKEAPGVKTYGMLSDAAKRGLEDFGFFRSRYFGRFSSPWQEDAAHRTIKLLATPDKEYVVLNCPPGGGKTTTFQHDLNAWLTCRNRAIRGLMGHRVQTIANSYAARLKRTLERTAPMQAKDHELQMGLAKDADASLCIDYGRFRPEDGSIWTRNNFIVAQLDETPVDEKESTWTAFGMDTGFLGYRVDFINWDDLVAAKIMRNEASIEAQRQWWDTEAETRLEPRGLLLLVGQRLGPVDLYRYCLDKESGLEEWEGDEYDVLPEDKRKKYHHFVYKAHYEDLCEGIHAPSKAVPWKPDGTGGCLLDPIRIPWRDQAAAKRNPLSNYETVYQQKDVDTARVLVQPVWVTGGQGLDGSYHPGCWDKDRGEWEWPKATGGLGYNTVTVDPSPANWWSIQFWHYRQDPDNPHLGGLRYLIAHKRVVMDAPSFLDYNVANRVYSGLIEEWWQLSYLKGQPFTRLIVEENAAQRFMLQYDHVKRWAMNRNVTIRGHQTQRNKVDEEFGIPAVAPHWMYGRIRLPGRPDSPGRLDAMKLVEEVTRWSKDGNHGTEDCVMAHWFHEFALPSFVDYDEELESIYDDIPSWVSGRDDLPLPPWPSARRIQDVFDAV